MGHDVQNSKQEVIKVTIANINEPAHDKTYNKTSATGEDSGQHVHPRSLIKDFANRMCLLQPPGYPKRDKREPLPYWVDVQVDPSLCWLHRSYCRFCRALAQIIIKAMAEKLPSVYVYLKNLTPFFGGGLFTM